MPDTSPRCSLPTARAIVDHLDGAHLTISGSRWDAHASNRDPQALILVIPGTSQRRAVRVTVEDMGPVDPPVRYPQEAIDRAKALFAQEGSAQ